MVEGEQLPTTEVEATRIPSTKEKIKEKLSNVGASIQNGAKKIVETLDNNIDRLEHSLNSQSTSMVQRIERFNARCEEFGRRLNNTIQHRLGRSNNSNISHSNMQETQPSSPEQQQSDQVPTESSRTNITNITPDPTPTPTPPSTVSSRGVS